jgi:hypothetical protein
LIGAIPWFVFIIKLRRQRRLAFAGEIQVPNRPDKFVPFNGAHHLKRLRPNAIPFGLAERDHGGVVVALSTPFGVHLDEAGASRPRCKTFSLHVLLALRCDSSPSRLVVTTGLAKPRAINLNSSGKISRLGCW